MSVDNLRAALLLFGKANNVEIYVHRNNTEPTIVGIWAPKQWALLNDTEILEVMKPHVTVDFITDGDLTRFWVCNLRR